jgi:hypothetical protein
MIAPEDSAMEVRNRIWHWLDTHSHWTKLRILGNSRLAKVTSVIPIVGSVLLLNYEFLEFITYTNIQDGTGGSLPFWRIHLLYYGSCFIAVATLIYAIFCPERVKKYEGIVEYTAAELPFFSFESHQEYHQGLLKTEYLRLSKGGKRRNEYLDELHQVAFYNNKDLARMMAAHFSALNVEHPISRMITYICYGIGFFLVSIPTAITFLQVTFFAVQRIF